jgi:Undecaprenyl-phosphate galactose phosphotransferase WbaP
MMVEPTNTQRTGLPAFSYYRRLVVNAAALLTSDAMALLLALVLAGFIRYLLKDHYMPLSRGVWVIPTWCAGAIAMRLVPGWGNGAVEDLRRIQILLAVVFAAAAIALFATKSAGVTSRIKFSLAYVLAVPLVPFGRILVKRALISAGEWGVPTVVYGTDTTAAHVLEALRSESGLGYQPYGIFDDHPPPEGNIHGVPVLGGLEDSAKGVPVAILGAPSIPRERLAELLDGPLSHYRRVIIIPDLLDIPTLWVSTRDFIGVLGLEVERNLLNPGARIVKFIFDLVCVVVTAPLWMPLCAILAVVVWAGDRHSPFFVQERLGRNGKVFRTYKFRTMVPNAERVLEEKLLDNPSLQDEWDGAYKLKDDPRITRAGRFLRRTSLDELPQLINVLKREMSLVGPRPLPSYHYQQLPRSVQGLRDSVRPGVTGLWQVSGRSSTGTSGMVRWDTYYVRNWSVWLDFIILIRTLRSVVQREGAF